MEKKSDLDMIVQTSHEDKRTSSPRRKGCAWGRAGTPQSLRKPTHEHARTEMPLSRLTFVVHGVLRIFLADILRTCQSRTGQTRICLVRWKPSYVGSEGSGPRRSRLRRCAGRDQRRWRAQRAKGDLPPLTISEALISMTNELKRRGASVNRSTSTVGAAVHTPAAR